MNHKVYEDNSDFSLDGVRFRSLSSIKFTLNKVCEGFTDYIKPVKSFELLEFNCLPNEINLFKSKNIDFDEIFCLDFSAIYQKLTTAHNSKLFFAFKKPTPMPLQNELTAYLCRIPDTNIYVLRLKSYHSTNPARKCYYESPFLVIYDCEYIPEHYIS